MATRSGWAFRDGRAADPVDSINMLAVLNVMKRRGLVRYVVLLGLTLGGVQSAAGCNDTPLIGVPRCRPGLCTCEEDPAQQTCKGFNERPEGGPVVPFDGGDTSPPLDANDAAQPDAPDDSGDGGDEAG